MNMTVEPGALRGAAAAPPSKSHAHRLLTAAALCEKDAETWVLHPGGSEDIAATARCLTALGFARVEKRGEGWQVTGFSDRAVQTVLDCGESGSTLRFLLPLCCLGRERRVLLTGRGRLPERPNAPLLDALRAHGACIRGDHLPMTVLRVFTRYCEDGANIDKQSTKAAVAQALRPVYRSPNCGAMTQALMELGATVCVPNGAPKC